MRIRLVGSRKPVEVKPSRSARCPSWKIQTTTPNDAPIEMTFISIALIGSTTEPKARNSSRNVIAPAISSAIQGSRSPRLSSWSRSAAGRPPTSTSAPAGAGSSRIAAHHVAGAVAGRLARVGHRDQRRRRPGCAVTCAPVTSGTRGDPRRRTAAPLGGRAGDQHVDRGDRCRRGTRRRSARRPPAARRAGGQHPLVEAAELRPAGTARPARAAPRPRRPGRAPAGASRCARAGPSRPSRRPPAAARPAPPRQRYAQRVDPVAEHGEQGRQRGQRGEHGDQHGGHAAERHRSQERHAGRSAGWPGRARR